MYLKSHMRPWGILFLLGLFLSSGTYGQESKTFTFQHFSKSEGLNQSSTNALYQDSEDVLWIGNFGGANAFDGYEFKSYVERYGDSTSLSDDVVWVIREDFNNDLWFGTKNGLCRFDRSTKSFQTFNPIERSTALAIKAIEPLDKKSILIGTEGEGLFLFDLQNLVFEKIEEVPRSKITSIAKSESSIWIGTENMGLLELNSSMDQVKEYLNSEELPVNFIRSLLIDQDEALWIGTDTQGLFVKEGKSKRIQHASNIFEYHAGDRIQAIKSDSANQIWIGSATKGLTIYNKKTRKCHHFQHNPGSSRTISDNDISSIHIGSNNVAYIGYYQKGFDKAIETAFHIMEHIPSDPSSLSNNNTYSFLHDSKGRFWVGTYGGGLNLLTSKSPLKFQHFKNDPNDPNSISHNWVRYLYEDSKNQIWIGTWGGGLNRFDEKTNRFIRYINDPKDPKSLSMNTVESIFEDSKGKIWVGTYGEGINIYQPQTNDFEQIKHDPNNLNSLSDDHITAFYEDSKSNIWISTYGGGLNKYNPEVGDFDRFLPDPDDSTSLNDFKVLFIFDEPNEDYFWLTTLGGGLNKAYPERGQFYNYTREDGLPNNTTIGMLKTAQNTYWINTNNGLSHFFPEDEKFINYSSIDGLSSDDFNLAAFSKDSLGYFYFGGKKGITYFNPTGVKPITTFPRLAITAIVIEDTHINTALSTFDVPYESSLSVRFAAINPARTQKIKYAYKLDADEKWNHLNTSRNIELVALAPGNRTIQIKSTNSDGAWNENSIMLSFYVSPPWYQTWLFRVMLTLFIIGLVVTYNRWRNNFLIKQRMILKREVEERTKTIQKKNIDLEKSYEERRALERFKESMVEMIAHDLKNPLVSIINRSQANADESSLNRIRKSGQGMLKLIENMLDVQRFQESKINLKQTKYSLFEQVANVLEELASLASDKRVTLKNEVRTGIMVFADERIIERVLSNLVSNAIKYSPAGSSVICKASVRGEKLKVSVKDFGEGIAKSSQELIFGKYEQINEQAFGKASATGLGLAFCRFAIESHNEVLRLKSKKGKGSTFSFTLPYEQRHISKKTVSSIGTFQYRFKETQNIAWDKYRDQILKLQIFETGQWFELMDELFPTNDHPLKNQLINMITHHDEVGLVEFKEQLLAYLNDERN